MKEKIVYIALIFVLFSPASASAIDVYEDFSQGYGGFAYFTPEYWGITVSDGRLKFRVADNMDPDPVWTYQAWIDPYSPTRTFYPPQYLSYYFDSFEISVDTFWEGEATDLGYGLYVCMQGSDSSADAIVFQIANLGYYGIWSIKRWVWTSIVPWTRSSLINGSLQRNVLSITKNGTYFIFRINGVAIAEKIIGDSSNFVGGGVGLCANALVDVDFDNFRVEDRTPTTTTTTTSTTSTTTTTTSTTTTTTLPPACPDCSDSSVGLENFTFSSTTPCECNARISITIGRGVTIKRGATVTFTAPTVRILSGFSAENGSVVKIKQQNVYSEDNP